MTGELGHKKRDPKCYGCPLFIPGERDGLVVNASDSRSRGRGFEPHSGQTVLCP